MYIYIYVYIYAHTHCITEHLPASLVTSRLMPCRGSAACLRCPSVFVTVLLCAAAATMDVDFTLFHRPHHVVPLPLCLCRASTQFDCAHVAFYFPRPSFSSPPRTPRAGHSAALPRSQPPLLFPPCTQACARSALWSTRFPPCDRQCSLPHRLHFQCVVPHFRLPQ